MKYVNYFLLAMLLFVTAVPAAVIFDRINGRYRSVEAPYVVEYNISKAPYTISPTMDRKLEVSNPIIKEIIEIELPN